MSKSKKAYKELWDSSDADKIDIGASDFFDPFYDSFLEGDHFKDVDLATLTVVDLGAGKGSRLAERLAEKGASVIAVDWMYENPQFPLRYSGKKIAADVLETGLGNNIADLVISANVTINSSHFAEEETKKKYVAEIVRILRPGGIFWGEEKDMTPQVFQSHPEVSEYSNFPDFYIHVFKKLDDKDSDAAVD